MLLHIQLPAAATFPSRPSEEGHQRGCTPQDQGVQSAASRRKVRPGEPIPSHLFPPINSLVLPPTAEEIEKRSVLI